MMSKPHYKNHHPRLTSGERREMRRSEIPNKRELSTVVYNTTNNALLDYADYGPCSYPE